jgi:hypothetical protein
MLIRRRSLAQARMPSMRALALNPRAPAVPVHGAGAGAQAPSQAPARGPQTPLAASAGDAETPAEWAARTGGFHESSYELQHGLHISESEWPEDVTIPGQLDEP